MIHRADDADLDAIEFRWVEDASTVAPKLRVETTIADDAVRRILETFLSVRGDWDDISLLARCAVRGRSSASDRRSLVFPSARFGEAGRLYLADGTDDPVEANEGAALRLLARWLRVLVDGAPDDALADDEWSELVHDVESIERGVAAGAADGSPPDSDMTWTTQPDD